MERKKVLVVDDEEKILNIVKLYLEKNGFEVVTCLNGKEGLNLFYKEEFILVILDLMLPDLSGEAICKEIRKTSQVPIIMLTAKIDEEYILNGFSLGADDYVLKPFSPKQLMARVSAILRRSEDAVKNVQSFNQNELVIDHNSYEVFKNNEKIVLTPIEFKILALLSTHKDRVFTREEIITSIYNDDFEGYDRAIDSHIKNLRKKILDHPPKYVLTVHGIGYRFGG